MPSRFKGRLIAILLTGGEAHDCPLAKRLICRVKPPKHMLGDKAYDSAELREDGVLLALTAPVRDIVPVLAMEVR